MTFISYAQNFEDVLLWRALRGISDGFYIDVGAAHPDIDSVTRAFYDRGWRGLNIEPVPEFHARLCAARPLDVSLGVAVGRSSSLGWLHVINGTGLSTVNDDLARQHGAAYDVRTQEVEVQTLASICARYAPATIHFLKIDVEGAEGAVLEGADFSRFRPWIVLVEATAPGTSVQTHTEWEPILLNAGYRFLWFDGLNRFYAADERYTELAPHFTTPVNVFDDFLRAADTEWARRISQAEMQVADLLERAMTAEAAVEQADRRAHDAEERAQRAEPRVLGAERRADAAERRLQDTETRLSSLSSDMQLVAAALRFAQADAASLRQSTSWRLMAPLRLAVKTAKRLAGRAPQAEPAAPPIPIPQPSWALPPSRVVVAEPATIPGEAPSTPMPDDGLPASRNAAPRMARVVHQFHSGSAVGDAITNSMKLIRFRLRALGYRSEIFVEHLDPALAGNLHHLADLPNGDDFVLIVHLSMGFDAYERILQVPAPKVLMYHNITPAALFEGQPVMQRYAELGRRQLAGLRPHVSAALADSDYNVLELQALGYEDARACTLLFDLDVLRQRVATRASGAGTDGGPEGAAQRDTSHPFTLLFVGRVVPSKAQLDLLEAFAAFRALDDSPSRLVLVGRRDGVGEDYAHAIEARIAALGLQDCVLLTGLVSDAELRAHYLDADLYVSLSRHEGFGVPLVEAAAMGLPVLAWPAGAVAYTLGGGAGLLHSRAPGEVAARIAELAGDAEARAALARTQGESLSRFDVSVQMDRMMLALARAGAPPPQDEHRRTLFERNLRFTVCGHVRGSYSLASINRRLALTLEQARPGRVRLLPVEGIPVSELGDVPAPERGILTALAAPEPHESGPVVMISQHYPVHVPVEQGDALLAFVFWEESLLPMETVAVLNESFQAVLAPARSVAKALVDSGVARPVHVVGFAPDLSRFAALPGPAQARRSGSTPSGDTGRTTFLHVSSAFPRKGIDVLLASYARAFRASDPVRLVIKTFPNPHNDAAAQIEMLRRTDPDAPYIELIDADLDEAALQALFEGADAVVLPARGEGFNLPAAEAMAAGVPLIVTGFGGHMDFCSSQNARLVRYRLAPSRSHVASASSLWAEPDVDDLAAALREVHEDRAGCLARASLAREAAAQAFDPGAFVRRVETAALDALLQPPPGRLRLCLISSWDIRCGVGDYAAFLVEAMAGADAELDVTVLADTRARPGIPKRRLRMRPVWNVLGTDIAGILRPAVAAEDPDVVLIQHQPGLIAWHILGETVLALALAAARRPIVVTLHNTASLPEADTDERETALAGLRRCARIIVHTLTDVERLRALDLQENVVLIPHGASEPGMVKPERTLLEGDPITIGCCGFLLPGKGIPALVQAVGKLRQTWPHVRLRLLNADYETAASHAEAAAVRAAIDEAGLHDAVELVTDYLPFQEVRWRLSRCDIIVLPYPHSKEGASGAMRMALSAGPCVAVTPIGFFDEAADAVWRLPGCTPAEMANGLATLLADQDARTHARQAAAAWLRDRQWPKIGARTVGMLRGLAAKAATAPMDCL